MDLVALEEIRRLKHRYLRCVDLKLWDEFAGVFTEDAVAEYDTPVLGETLRLEGRDAIVEYMRSNLGPDKISAHTAGCPEIEIDGDRATGIWSLDDTIILPGGPAAHPGRRLLPRRLPPGRRRVAGREDRAPPDLRVHGVAGRRAEPEVHHLPLSGTAALPRT
ncbi:hypothetical protein BJY14_003558 [Actinomadura luteofluorescens]|uniref:SnoaL-like domain-containing protein n=1 Tax=Actinomadura luteofluorescens TaxID=46163 RepID=A0A7Y9JG21_9ACTN|nr:nuclear transport factor 2 family protein [Actinomadura luteofluorescens]NYD47575.1 hypothetical protein [Actinomadura luteofluorescens]